ncbi:MAG TPA: hypothetical protein VH414_18465 [Lichenihabitans sp.]|jgi:hypothetical protein|nr:hypothetical protein [Lichenihabitans sp.]
MPKPEDERTATERSLRNVVFLIETQMRLVTELTEAGQESGDARAMLRKLMDLEIALRQRAEALGQPDAGARAA